MNSIEKLKHIEILPNTINNIFILLHGYGTDNEDLIGLGMSFRQLLPNTAFLFVNAPWKVDGNDNMGYQWFSLKTMNLFSILKEIKTAHRMLNDFINEQLIRFSLNDSNLFMGGFSQGAIMTLYTGLRRKVAPLALLSFSGMIPDTLGTLKKEIMCKPNTLLIHGTEDKVVPYNNLERTEKILKEFDIPVESHSISGMGHMIDNKALNYALEFIKKVCNITD